MKKLALILFFACFALIGKAQNFMPLDTTIGGVNYQFKIHSISYSFNADSCLYYRGYCNYRVNKKDYQLNYDGTLPEMYLYIMNDGTLGISVNYFKLKEALRIEALKLIGEL
jgi:hypothetical protein